MVDDDHCCAESIRIFLQHSNVGERSVSVSVYSRAEVALDQCSQVAADIFIVDVRMPRINGFEMCKRLRGEHKYLNLIVLYTGCSLFSVVKDALACGANGIICKSCGLSGLRDALNKLCSSPNMFFALTNSAMEDLSPNGLEGANGFDIRRLSKREKQIVRLIYRGSITKQIAFELNISEQYVKNCRSRIIRKLGCASVIDVMARFSDQIKQLDQLDLGSLP